MKKQILSLSVIAFLAISMLNVGCKKASNDTTKPVITLNGEATTYWQVGKTYSDAGASAHDETDGNVSVTSSGTVNALIAGTYTINYEAKDAAGNKATATRTIYVVNFDGSYTLVQSACTDALANGTGSSTVSASGVSAANGMTIQDFGLYTANVVMATFNGTSITVAKQASSTGTSGDQIEGTGTITGQGTVSSPLKFTFQFIERDAANVIFNQGTSTVTHL